MCLNAEYFAFGIQAVMLRGGGGGEKQPNYTWLRDKENLSPYLKYHHCPDLYKSH